MKSVPLIPGVTHRCSVCGVMMRGIALDGLPGAARAWYSPVEFDCEQCGKSPMCYQCSVEHMHEQEELSYEG